MESSVFISNIPYKISKKQGRHLAKLSEWPLASVEHLEPGNANIRLSERPSASLEVLVASTLGAKVYTSAEVTDKLQTVSPTATGLWIVVFVSGSDM
jgi:hypothetical protein